MQLDQASRSRRLAFLPSVEAVFEDFKGRRAGLLKALTCDIDELLRQCDPFDDKEALCLFGFPNGSWEVTNPGEDVPSERPEPFVGINHTTDRMGREQWLLFVASHSDSWLLSTALFAASPFDHVEKQKLFDLMTTLPTLYQMVSWKIEHSKQNPNCTTSSAQDVCSSGASASRVTTVEKRTDRPTRRPARSSVSLKTDRPLQKPKERRCQDEDHPEKKRKLVDPRKSEEEEAVTKSGAAVSSYSVQTYGSALDACPLEFDLNQMPGD